MAVDAAALQQQASAGEPSRTHTRAGQPSARRQPSRPLQASRSACATAGSDGHMMKQPCHSMGQQSSHQQRTALGEVLIGVAAIVTVQHMRDSTHRMERR